MLKKILAITLSATLIFTGCSSENTDNNNQPVESAKTAEENSDGGSWAIYWYLCGSDLESDEGAATADLGELTSVSLPENVKFVIQTGGASSWQNEMISADKIGRYVYDSTGFNQVDQLENANMGDPDTLSSFLSFCNEKYPADHKMVIFWDHGGGSASGASQDENYDGDCLTIPELRKAFEASCTPSAEKPPYDIIGFDTCLMATIDVAGIFKDMGKYLVASEEYEPGNGWSYDAWIGELAKNTSMGADELGKIICDTFYSSCEQFGVADEATLSVTDLSKIDQVLNAYNAFGDDVLRGIVEDDSETFAGNFAKIGQETQNYGGNTSKSGYSDMADMGDMARLSDELLPKTAKPLADAIEKAVIYQIKGKFREKATGLSCYYNYSNDPVQYKGYHKASQTQSFDCLYQIVMTGTLDDNNATYCQKLFGDNVAETTQPVKTKKKDYEKHKVEIVNGTTARLKLGAKKASRLSSVNYGLAIFDEDAILYLGTDNSINADWEKGVFDDDFQGLWGAIDGHLVFMEVEGKGDDYTLYSIPVILNDGKSDDYRIIHVSYNRSNNEGKILGISKPMENGLSSKDMKQLSEGDKITTVFIGGSFDGDDSYADFIDVESFKVTNDTKFDMTELGDGKYSIDFEMNGVDGKQYTSDMKMFTVNNNVMEYI